MLLTVSRRALQAGAGGVFVLVLAAVWMFFSDSGSGVPPAGPLPSAAAESLQERFAYLANAGSNVCAGPGFLEGKAPDARLQGACCGAMDFHRYAEQIEGLKKYEGISQIPSDPYDIPVPLADELLAYGENIQLSAEQQAVYDQAVGLSHEGGPCCCKCWRWYAFEGQAKYLITQHGFSAEQVAEVWDLEDGCGGPGHAHEDSL